MARMRKGGGDDPGLMSQALSSDEQDMVKAMADELRASGANPFGSQHGSQNRSARPRPNATTTARSISLMAQGGSVTASELDGKVQLQAAPGTNDGGIRLLCSWCPDWAPVCAADGHTLPSACWARSVGLEVSRPGACPGAGAAPQQGQASDGERGTSTTSMVEAPLQPTHAPHAPHAPHHPLEPYGSPSQSEVVDPVCGCPLLQLLDAAPVCGSNGKTYDSYCWARCEQIELSHLGPCTTKGRDV